MVEREHIPDEHLLRASLREYELHIVELYNALPSPATPAFWPQLIAVEMPVEVLVLCVRKAHMSGDYRTRNRILELIVQRIGGATHLWAEAILRKWHLLPDEREHLVADLCADLYERILHALLDESRLFWAINFYHCLYFERLHVYTTFLRREGLVQSTKTHVGMRIPRNLLIRLDQPLVNAEGQPLIRELEDGAAQKMLLSLEYSELLHLVLHLPSALKLVILLAFWEGRSEKEVAHLLGISDRTVRNRIRAASKWLYEQLEGDSVHE